MSFCSFYRGGSQGSYTRPLMWPKSHSWDLSTWDSSEGLWLLSGLESGSEAPNSHFSVWKVTWTQEECRGEMLLYAVLGATRKAALLSCSPGHLPAPVPMPANTQSSRESHFWGRGVQGVHLCLSSWPRVPGLPARWWAGSKCPSSVFSGNHETVRSSPHPWLREHVFLAEPLPPYAHHSSNGLPRLISNTFPGLGHSYITPRAIVYFPGGDSRWVKEGEQ